jgi:type IV pilus assembly protein PilB
MARKKLGEMLVEAGVLSEQGLRAALAEQRRWGGTLGQRLVEMKLVNEAELVRVLASQLHLQPIDLDHLEIHPSVLDLIPGEVAEQYSIVPFAQPMKFLDVAMAEPTNLGIIDELRIRTQLNIRPYLAGPKMIERALAKHYRRGFGGSLRRDAEVSLDSAGDTVSIDGGEAKPDAAAIEAARRREGLRPAKPTRPPAVPGPPPVATRDAEIDVLQERISTLEALVARDEDVLRKLLALLVEKGIATREEILEYIR